MQWLIMFFLASTFIWFPLILMKDEIHLKNSAVLLTKACIICRRYHYTISYENEFAVFLVSFRSVRRNVSHSVQLQSLNELIFFFISNRSKSPNSVKKNWITNSLCHRVQFIFIIVSIMKWNRIKMYTMTE